jgi:hypothetical protein
LIRQELSFICHKSFVINEAWGNICKKGDEVLEHNHRGTTSFCGILYLTENGPGTFFKDLNINVDEKIGKFVLFHPILFHQVKKIENDIERITVAFNMNEVDDFVGEKGLVL